MTDAPGSREAPGPVAGPDDPAAPADGIARFCSRCGKPNPHGRPFCDTCGLALTVPSKEPSTDQGAGSARSAPLAPDAAPPAVHLDNRRDGAVTTAPLASLQTATNAIRRRPTWLVYVLSVVTLGLYFVWWFGASWADLKRVTRDPGMRPLGHALAYLVPVYGQFRLHAHYRTLNELLAKARLEPVLMPGTMVLASLVGAVLGLIAQLPRSQDNGPLVLVLVVASGVVLGWMIDQWEAALVAYHARSGRSAVPTRVRRAEWAILVLGGLVFLFLVVGLLVAPA